MKKVNNTVKELIFKLENSIEDVRFKRNNLLTTMELASKLNFNKEVDYMREESVRLMNEIDIYKEILTDLNKIENGTL